MNQLSLYEPFENCEYIKEEDIDKISNYICGNLNSWFSNRSYWYAQYTYYTNLNFVWKWRKEKGFRPIVKKGETICNDK